MGQIQQHKWDREAVAALFDLPFFELVQRAHQVHQQNFDATEMELCTLLSIKTGACPEDCKNGRMGVGY